MTYEIRWTESAFRKFEKLDKEVRERIARKLESMSEEPLLVAKKLTGANLYSLGVGDYRVIMSIESGIILVLIIDVGHRSKIYKKL